MALTPDQKERLVFSVDTGFIDGERTIVAVADPGGKVAELCERNNGASAALRVEEDPARWPHRRNLIVHSGALTRIDEPVAWEAALPNADPGSVRVAERVVESGKESLVFVPAQFEPGENGAGPLLFVLTGATPPESTRRFAVLWREREPNAEGHFLAPGGGVWDGAGEMIRTPVYECRLDNGVVTDIAIANQKGEGPFISSLIVSSEQTGWCDEPGTVEHFDVLSDGPVRTRIRVGKVLKGGFRYEKTYCFYRGHVDVSVTRSAEHIGLLSRAYYVKQGSFEDSGGVTAVVDGDGGAEDVLGKTRNPKWHAVYAEEWAHACIALSPFHSLTYWDSGAWGGIGFEGPKEAPAHMRYVFQPGAGNADFARDACARAAAPVEIAWK